MVVTIIDWHKYQPRKDVKNPSWFRLDHDLFENHDFFDFSHAEICSWVYLLCVASRKSSDQITLNMSHVERIGRIKEQDFRSALIKLQNIKCIKIQGKTKRITLRTRNANDTDACTTLHNSTLHNSTEQDTTLQVTKNMLAPASKVAWESYLTAYTKRYECAPIRNAKVNSLLKQLSSRLPGEHLGEVIHYYLQHKNPYYVQRGHSLECLLRDAEKVYTEWKTGRAVTNTEARQGDRDQALRNKLDKIERGEL